MSRYLLYIYMVEECLRRAPDASKAMLGAQYSGAIIEHEHALHRKSAAAHDQVVSMTRFSAGSVDRRFFFGAGGHEGKGMENVAQRTCINRLCGDGYKHAY